MTAPYNPPVKGEAFAIKISLRSIANPDFFVVNPQINAGDFKVDRWEAGSPSSVLTNLTTLPTVDPPGSVLVLIQLSAAEMSGDIISIVGRQQGSPQEWADFTMSIPTTQ